MNHLFKGAVLGVGVTIVLMIINIIINIVCNKNGIDLNSTVMSTISTLIGVFSVILIYNRWIRDEKDN